MCLFAEKSFVLIAESLCRSTIEGTANRCKVPVSQKLQTAAPPPARILGQHLLAERWTRSENVERRRVHRGSVV